MKIDGKKISTEINENLKRRVEKLKEKNITPGLAIILVGEDPASKAYVGRKELKAKEIGANVNIYHFPATANQEELLHLINKLNSDSSIHGIIVQRPLPPQDDGNIISTKTDPKKDIDSFHPDSPYPMPLAAAVLKILEEVYKEGVAQEEGFPTARTRYSATNTSGALVGRKPATGPQSLFLKWLKSKKIIIIGKGETGGGPTIKMLKDMGIEPEVIDSKTTNPKEIAKKADILISTVGKSNIVKPEMLKKNVILVSVGLHRAEDGKLHGDYEEDEIKHIASFYTPTPGGVGPVNVTMLLENLLSAAENLN